MPCPFGFCAVGLMIACKAYPALREYKPTTQHMKAALVIVMLPIAIAITYIVKPELVEGACECQTLGLVVLAIWALAVGSVAKSPKVGLAEPDSKLADPVPN